MLRGDGLTRQIAVLWQGDQLLGAVESIHRRSLNPSAATIARGQDYAAGVHRAFDTGENLPQALRWYKRQQHARVIDAGMFRIGFERGRFVLARDDHNTLTAPVTVPLAEKTTHAQIHFIYAPFTVGQRLPDGSHVTDVRQAFISVTPKTLHLAPGSLGTSRGQQVVTPTLVTQLGQPVLEFIPVAEHLLRPVPAPHRR